MSDTLLDYGKRAALGLVPGALSNFLVPKGDQGAAGYLPGAATGAYSGVDSLLGMAYGAVRHALPYIASPAVSAILPEAAARARAGIEKALPPVEHFLPGAEEASRLHELSLERARENVPTALAAAPATTRGQEMATNFGENIGTMAFPGTLLKVPGMVGKILKAAVPTIKELPVTGPLAGAFSLGTDVVTNVKTGTGVSDAPIQNDPHASSQPETLATSDKTQAPAPDKPTPTLTGSSGFIGFDSPAQLTRLSAPRDTEPIPPKAGSFVPFDSPTQHTGDTTSAQPQSEQPASLSYGVPDFGLAAGETDKTIGQLGGWAAAGAALLGLVGAAGMRGHGVSAYRGALDLLHGRKVPDHSVVPPIQTPAPGTPAATPGAAAHVPPVAPARDVTLPANVDMPYRQAWLDKNTVIDNLQAAVADTPNSAREFQAMTGNSVDMSRMARLESQANTGISYLTGSQHMPIRELARDVRGLGEKRAIYDQYLNFKDELQNRYNNMIEEINKKGRISDDNLVDHRVDPGRRVGYIEHSDEAIRNWLKQVEQDHPDVASAAARFKRVTDELAQEIERTGFRTADEVKKLLKFREWVVPTVDERGLITHPFGPRDTTPGSRANYINADPTRALAQHYDAVYAAMEQNMIHRKLIEDTLRKQARDPTFAKVFTETRTAQPNTRNITWRDRSGKERHVQVNSPVIYNGMKTNPFQLGLIGDIAATSKRVVQSGSTGPLALVAGKVFPFVDAIRNAALIPITAHKGSVVGRLDALSQKHFGVSTRWLPDPTRIPGIAAQGGKDLGAMFAGRMADALHPRSGDKFAQNLRTILGDSFVNSAHQRLKGVYDSSAFARQRAQGLRGTGAHGSTEVATGQDIGLGNRTMRTSLAAVEPSLFRSRLGGQAMDFRGLVHDIFNAISGAPVSHYHELNRRFNLAGRSPEELAHMTRTVVGDPGVAGGGRAARTVAATIPYSNVSAQGLRAIARAYKTNGRIATIASMTTSVVVPALASLFTAMRSGPEAVQHLQDEVSTAMRASDVILYRGEGEAPESATRLSLPQELRIPYALTLEIIATGLGAFQAREGEDMHARIYHVLEDVFSHRLSNTTLQSVLHAGQDTFGFKTPPLINAGLNLVGKQMDSPLPIDTIANNIIDNKPFYTGIARDLIRKGGSPNEGHDNIATENDATVLRSIVNNLAGVSGKAWDTVASGVRDFKDYGGDWGHALGAIAEQYTQGIRDQTPMLNSVWKQSAKLSAADPLEEHVNATMAALRPLAGAATDIKAEGLTRPHGAQIDTGDTSKVPPESQPEMRRMYILAGQVGGALSRRFSPMITDMRKQIEDATKKNDYYAADQRALVNQHTRELHGEYVKLNAKLQELNKALSHIAGRHVDIRRIDWSKGLEQFD